MDARTALLQTAKTAKSRLSWLGQFKVASQQRMAADSPPIEQMLLDAVGIVQKSDRIYCGKPASYTTQEVERFESACKRLYDNAPGLPAQFINEMAIVNAASSLEGYLRTAARLFSVKQSKSVGNLLLSLEMKFPSFEQLGRHVRFLDQMRHVIVHCGGIVDGKFLANATADRDTHIWPDESTFRAAYRENSPLALDVITVLVPYLAHAIDFVEASCQFLTEKLELEAAKLSP